MTTITVGLVNNMPDTALEATEAQFSSLLSAAAAAGRLAVELRLTSLPEVARGPAAAARIAADYWPLPRLLADPPDALIVTGAEPIAPNLDQEPYWERFTRLVEWSLTNVKSSIWSCLAAHAAVQHLSGVTRQRLPGKCHGVFEHALAPHALTAGLATPMITPHSRWNDLDAAALRAAGYEILSEGAHTGASIFALARNGGLLLFLQGHPEYERDTLLKEYRRDVGRFVRGQQAHYPAAPRGYFPESARRLLEEFAVRASAERRAEVMSHFPVEALQQGLETTWRAGAEGLYRNWLQYVARAKAP